jgi:DNA-binding MarR family transcriptional regulator
MARAARKSDSGGLDLQRFVPYRLSVLTNRVSRAIAARYAAEFDLTIPEWRVLAVLGAERTGLTAGELADATAMDKVAISRAVARLMRKRRVAAQEDISDRRRQVLRLSALGQRVYERVAPVALECEARLLEALSPRELDLLDAMLSRLSAAALKL